MQKNKLTQKRLKELLDYNPENGIFVWKVAKAKSVRIGCVAGTTNKDGYIEIGIDYNRYLAHRLAWFYVYGYFPEHDIDHINRIKTENFIDNLREVSNQCNQRNTGNRNNNTSGVKGVSWHKDREKWMAYIAVNQNIKYLGLYNELSNAVCARLMAEQCLNWSGCDSNSPAYQYVKEMLKVDKQKG